MFIFSLRYLLERLKANGLGNYQSIQYSGQPGIFGKLLQHGLDDDPFPRAVRKNNNKTEKSFSLIGCAMKDNMMPECRLYLSLGAVHKLR